MTRALEPSAPRRTIALLTATQVEFQRITTDLPPWGAKAEGGAFRLGDTRIVAGISGIGPDRADLEARRILDRDRIDWLLLLGVAGALDPRWPTGHLIRARWVIDTNGSAAVLTDRAPAIRNDPDDRRPEGTLLTTDHVIDSAAQKRALFEQYRACAVDTESFVVAKVAAEHGVPLTVLRAIADTADFAMPAACSDWIGPDGRTRTGAVFRHILTHPRQFATLKSMKRQAEVACDRLAAEVRRILGA